MERTPEEVAERVFAALLGMVDVIAIHLGDRLGYYRSLVSEGPASADELAQRTASHPRYAREWLEQQAVTGLLEVAQDGAPQQRRFAIGPGAAEVLADPTSLNYLAPLARLFAATGPALPSLLNAFRRGGGVSRRQLGPDAREAQAEGNRPWYDACLAPALADVPEVHATLSRPGVRVVDVGCGGGWSTITLARAYPRARVTGIDVDGASIALARRNASAAGVEVTFGEADGADLEPGSADVVFAFECVHDLPRPVEVIRSVRRSLGPDGFFVVMDEAVAEQFGPDGDDVERLMYGLSLLIGLPDGMSSQPSAGTGTVMRPSQLEDYAQEAGFTSTEVLPIEDFGFWRFYLLR